MARRSVIKKKGLSPVITTVLLIALVVVIVSIIFLWFRGMVQEGVTKFGKNINLVCDDVKFDATYAAGTLSVVNTGNIPIFRIEIRISNNGNFVTEDIMNTSAGSSWPSGGLGQGATFSGNIQSDIGSANDILIIPELIGTSPSGKETLICGGQYGKDITIS